MVSTSGKASTKISLSAHLPTQACITHAYSSVDSGWMSRTWSILELCLGKQTHLFWIPVLPLSGHMFLDQLFNFFLSCFLICKMWITIASTLLTSCVNWDNVCKMLSNKQAWLTESIRQTVMVGGFCSWLIIVVVQSLSHVWLFVTRSTTAHQASLSQTVT